MKLSLIENTRTRPETDFELISLQCESIAEIQDIFWARSPIHYA